MNKNAISKLKSKILGESKKHWRLIAVGIVIGFIISTIFSSSSPKGHKMVVSSEEKKIRYWTCSMHPQIKLPKPGKCPICAMDLIPIYEGGSTADEGPVSLTLSKTGYKLAEIETTEVKYKEASNEVRLVGKVDYDETRLYYITAWVGGRIDKLYVDFTGIKVRKNDNLIKLYSPELLATQEEYIQAIKNLEEVKDSQLSVIRDTAKTTLSSAKEKLRLYGITQEQIEDIIKRGSPKEHMTITSPVTGTVIHKKGIEGMYVKTGDKIYTIADLSHVWLFLDAYESDIQWLRYGQDVNVEAESYPGEIFKGKIAFIDPFVDEKTRTIKLRVNVDNKDEKLKPGMFVRATIKSILGKSGNKVLVIPKTAPLITGKRAIVYVEKVSDKPGIHRYEGKEVVLGPRAGDFYVVLSGLKEGERVVSSGNFKIDSALQIQAKPSMMNPANYYSEGENIISQGVSNAAQSAGILSSALPYYLSVSSALSQDDAQKGAYNFNEFKEEVDRVIKRNSLEEKSEGIAVEINFIAQKLTLQLRSRPNDLDSLRRLFADISEVLKKILEKYEYKEDLKLYLSFCPMAFSGKGAYWLQDSEQIRNPYFGIKMSKCGEVKGEYGRKIKKTKPMTGHAGHKM